MSKKHKNQNRYNLHTTQPANQPVKQPTNPPMPINSTPPARSASPSSLMPDAQSLMPGFSSPAPLTDLKPALDLLYRYQEDLTLDTLKMDLADPRLTKMLENYFVVLQDRKSVV